MNFFDNLLIELSGRTFNSCPGDCYDVCAGVSQHINDCKFDCTYSCTAESADEPIEGGGEELCKDCALGCTAYCQFACGAFTCEENCILSSTTSK